MTMRRAPIYQSIIVGGRHRRTADRQGYRRIFLR